MSKQAQPSQRHAFSNRFLAMPDNAARDLFPGALEMMVLRLLKQEPLHGYALVQRIQQTSRNLL